MAASLVGLSIPTLERNLLNDLCRLSLFSFSRRNICIKCHKQHSLINGKSMMSSKQASSYPTLCNMLRRYCCNHVTTTVRHHRHSHGIFSTNKTESSSLLCLGSNNNHHNTFASLTSSSTSSPSSQNFHKFKHIQQSQEPLTDFVFQKPLLLATSNCTYQCLRQFHVKSSPSLSSSSTSTSSSSSTSSSFQAADIPEQVTLVDPFKMMEEEMKEVMVDLRKELRSEEPLLQHMSQYYFNGKGKTFRPLVALLMARACNIHSGGSQDIRWQQKIVAMVAEMIHTASLVHDDVIDASDTRRSQASLNRLYGQRQAILTGDYIISQASIAVSRTRHNQVIKILARILVDLVDGEFMQLGSKENENERFTHYFDKTYKKTASLIANCCKSAAILGDCGEELSEICFQYGRNLGLAFQLIDDLLDFTSSHTDMGKPTEADLKQGLATAPVLFASQEFPELHAMIMRRFSQEGDVEFARNAVDKSDGIEQTRLLATQHSKEAIRNVQNLTDSDARQGLIRLAQILLERKN